MKKKKTALDKFLECYEGDGVLYWCVECIKHVRGLGLFPHGETEMDEAFFSDAQVSIFKLWTEVPFDVSVSDEEIYKEIVKILESCKDANQMERCIHSLIRSLYRGDVRFSLGDYIWRPIIENEFQVIDGVGYEEDVECILLHILKKVEENKKEGCKHEVSVVEIIFYELIEMAKEFMTRLDALLLLYGFDLKTLMKEFDMEIPFERNYDILCMVLGSRRKAWEAMQCLETNEKDESLTLLKTAFGESYYEIISELLKEKVISRDKANIQGNGLYTWKETPTLFAWAMGRLCAGDKYEGGQIKQGGVLPMKALKLIFGNKSYVRSASKARTQILSDRGRKIKGVERIEAIIQKLERDF